MMGYQLLTGKNAALEVNAEDSSGRMPTFPPFPGEWDEDTIIVFKWGFHPKHEIGPQWSVADLNVVWMETIGTCSTTISWGG